MNLYAFCENGPANHIDPLGLDTNDITKSSNPAVTGGKKSCCSVEDKLKELEKMIKNAVEKTQNDSISISVVLTRSQLIQFANSKDPIKIPEPKILHREYAGYICCDEATGEVSSTGPFPGTWRLSNGDYSDNPNVLANATGFQPTSGNVSVDDNAKCGKGLTPVAYYHSHPPESQGFSKGDEGSFLPIALGIPGWNKWLLFNPTTRKQFTYEYTEDIK